MKKGIALVITILTLLVLSMLAAGLALMTKTETQIAGYHIRSVEALEYAQAGFNNIVARLDNVVDPAIAVVDTANPPNPNWMFVFSANIDSINDPVTGDAVHFRALTDTLSSYYVDDIDITTFDPTDSSTWDGAIIVKYKTSASTGEMYFYDPVSGSQVKGSPSLSSKYFPVIEIYVKAQMPDGTQKTIKAEVAKNKFTTSAPASLSGKGMGLLVKGNTSTYVCGHNHLDLPFPNIDTDTTYFDTNLHIPRPDGKAHPSLLMEYDSICGQTGCIAGMLSEDVSVLQRGPNSTLMYHGNPDVSYTPNYDPPELWELLGYNSEADMLADTIWEDLSTYGNEWPNIVDTTSFHYFICNADTLFIQNTSTKSKIRGIIYARHNVSFKVPVSTPVYALKGMLYVEGDFYRPDSVYGRPLLWVLGSTIVKGDFVSASWGQFKMWFLYSSEYADKVRERIHPRGFRVLGWKEIAE